MSDHNWKFVRLVLSWQSLLTVIITNCLLIINLVTEPAIAQKRQDCRVSSKATQEKENLRLLAFRGNKDAEIRYQKLLKQHTQELQECRSRVWPETQAIWLRLYPCDTQPGIIDQIMDRIVNQGYNQVYLEVFYDGRVLLPAAANPTAWPAVVRTIGAEKVDLLAAAIKKGQQRGLKVYAWMFTNNFGYTYAQRPDRQDAIARNGKNQTSLSVVEDSSQVFIDPYNTKAKTDYYQMVQQVVRRRPDGILFDYVRYPRQTGSDSIATKVHDLWLFTAATQEVLFRRAKNSKGLELIRRFLTRGYVSAGDIAEVDKRYPQEDEPMWEGRIPPKSQKSLPSPQEKQRVLQLDLWLFTVAHAMQGILDFVALASYPAKQQGIPAGVVFFPEGNQALGQGYDSRL
ncbi:MAG: family 10 glycosylhydrolase, partial [Dolichospermum sp.]|nr:family 10 glycosylhydrolase [Dolichospermum sp.]